MNPIRTIRRLAPILAGLTAAVLAFAAATPALAASLLLPPGSLQSPPAQRPLPTIPNSMGPVVFRLAGPAAAPQHLPGIPTTLGPVVFRLAGPASVPQGLPAIHPAAAGGTPGWQIALIAAAAALAAAIVAVLFDRALAARRHGAARTA